MAKLKGQLFARLALDYFDHPKIARLSPEAVVAHLEMLVYSRKYLTDGVIPMRIAMRYALHVVDELQSNDPVNPSVVKNEDGSLILHGYSDFQETREEVESRRNKRRQAAQSRWSGDASSNAKRNAQSNAGSNAETETETETYINPSPSVPDEGRFDEFWEVYPRRIAKKEAMKKFDKAVKDGANPQALIDGAKAYAAATVGKEQKYIAHPTTWLNQGRWEDETTTTPTMSDAERADRLRNPWKYT